MSDGSAPAATTAETSMASGELRGRPWKRFLRGPDPALIEELYVPMLAEAVRYDRCCAYFSSSVLAAAARGFGKLIERLEAMGDTAPRPAVRLVVNEELPAEDVRALTERGDTFKLEEALQRRFKHPSDLLEEQRLAMLGWLAQCGLLEVRVGVMRRGEGIVHAKFGIGTNAAGDAIVFSGSGNESAQGLLANYERLEVSTSWDDPERHREYAREFEALWKDRHPDVHTVTLPEALRLKLVKLAPAAPPIREPVGTLPQQRAAMLWQFIVEAPYLPNGGAACDATALVNLWPHQSCVVEEVAEAWPEGRLLCDEVGMGKTIEAILILRRLMAGRGVRRVLFLLPAGLLKQWQGELREKGGLVFPRLEGMTLVWPGERSERVSGLAEALERDVLLMSRETARTENNLPILLAAKPWDLVMLDEAHAARRRKQEEGEFNSGTLLLTLLRYLQLRRRACGILLLSATPMQTHPWEPWDLLAVLGEGGRWLADFAGVRDFYTTIAAVHNGRCDLESARKAAALIVADPQFPSADGDGSRLADLEGIARKLAFAAPSQRQEVAQWLRRGAPLARRMHRNTRATLRQYYERGLLSDPPPLRNVEDIVFDYTDPAERGVYNAVGQYIAKRYDQLEREKPGKGFVMTIYRRRASSSPLAIERSLERRREGLLRVAQRKAYDLDLSSLDVPDAVDPDDLPEGEGTSHVSAALPSDPQVARAELLQVEQVLDLLHALHGRDSKRDRFFDVLRRITEDGRPVLVFTEYADTLEYLRDTLMTHYGKSVGCYSGEGGQLWDGEAWTPVSKNVITAALREGKLRVLICTDAASEGLNLQAAGAVINYDLPWNPSRVEQRIGRIDRIGQRWPLVLVVNLFLKDSVDDRVYRVLRIRCGLFEQFVGAMQPVLARARRMLLGQDPADLEALTTVAQQVERDPVAGQTYLESPADAGWDARVPLNRQQVESALAYLQEGFGFEVESDDATGIYVVSGPGFLRAVLTCKVDVLEHDHQVLPLSPFEPRLRELADRLLRPGERLPLVIGSHQRDAFRCSVAYWVSDEGTVAVETMGELLRRVEVWTGTYPDPAEWLRAHDLAQEEAEAHVKARELRGDLRERQSLQRQREAARVRLQQELGRYLVCLGGSTADLNGLLYHHMSRDIASRRRLMQCMEKLAGYPEWDPKLCRDLESFAQTLTENQRKARLLGKELDAALEDPRWMADLPA
jgi:Helicase conserved C-terminal domain/SNF2-related domain